MEISTLNLLASALSAALMVLAVVYILTYILGFFSSTRVLSPKVVLFSLSYFFGSAILLFKSVEWYYDLAHTRTQVGTSFYLNIGASALGLAAILHILCGSLTVLLYLRGQLTQGRPLNRLLNSIRTRKRRKSKQ